MKKFKFIPPYKSPGKTNFPKAQNHSGVYLIKENGKLVYVGYSAKNLYKTMYRHFQQWHHNYQEAITYVNKLNRHKYLVRVIYCTPQQAQRLERALIIKHKPRDNDMKYKQHILNFQDRKTVEIYNETPVTTEDPF